MKIFNQAESGERNELLKKLTFNVSEYLDDSFDIDDDSKLFITFYEEDGCVYDNDEITYLFQNELPNEMSCIVEGLFGYDGELSEQELTELLSNIGFKSE